MKIKSVNLKDPIKEAKYRKYTELRRLSLRDGFKFTVIDKQRMVLVNDDLLIPFENIAYMTIEKEDGDK